MRRLACILLVTPLFLAGCGGGGGGGNSSPGPGQGGGPITPTANVTVAITSSAINASITQGDPYSATVSGTWSATNLGSGAVYLQVSDSANTFTLPAIQAAPANGTFSYALPVAAGLATGERTGTITVKACKDAACTNAHAGTSGSVAYRLTVNSVPDWETVQGNAAHNGYVPITLDASKFAKAWEWKAPSIPGTSFVYVGMLVTGGDNVYSLVTREAANGLADSYVALAEASGTLRWETRLGPVTGSAVGANNPAYSAGRLYAGVSGAAEYSLLALDSANGNSVFQTNPGFSPRAGLAPTPYDGGVYAMDRVRGSGSQPNRLFSMGRNGGTPVWSQSIDQPEQGNPFFAPAVDAQYLYYHDACCLKMLDRRTGALIASVPNTNADAGNTTSRLHPVAIGSRGNVLAGAYTPAPAKRLLSSFNIATRTREWTASLDFGSYMAVANGVVYVTRLQDEQPSLYAIDEANGQVLWTWTPPAGDAQTSLTGNIVATRNLVFFSTANTTARTGKTWAIDIASRQAVWSHPAPGNVVISSTRMLYITPMGDGFAEDSIVAFRTR